MSKKRVLDMEFSHVYFVLLKFLLFGVLFLEECSSVLVFLIVTRNPLRVGVSRAHVPA